MTLDDRDVRDALDALDLMSPGLLAKLRDSISQVREASTHDRGPSAAVVPRPWASTEIAVAWILWTTSDRFLEAAYERV